MTFFSRLSTSKQQNGAVLAVSLVILLLVTIIGVTATQVTGLEEKMSANMRDRNMAFQAAEAALRAGETFLTQATLPAFTAAGTNGLYTQGSTSAPGPNANWNNFNTVAYNYDANLLATAPRYFIQRLPNVESGASLDAGTYDQNELYRVTAKGVGGTSSAVVVLQSVYKR